MGKVFNMVGGGGSASFSATINVTNATPNEVVTATLLNTATTYSATALADGTATILIGTMGAYNLTCTDRYSPSEVSVSQSGATYSARMLTIPNTYQEVEYIEGTGTQYIKTGINTSNSMEAFGDFILTDSSSRGTIIGSDVTAGISGAGSTDYLITNSALNPRRYQNGQDITYTSISCLVGTKYTYVFRTNGKNMLNDIAIVNISGNLTVFGEIFLLALNRASYGAQGILKARISYCKIYNNSVLVRDFVACYRKSDNIAGLYDKISNTLFLNGGSGTFVVGGDVT